MKMNKVILNSLLAFNLLVVSIKGKPIFPYREKNVITQVFKCDRLNLNNL